MGPIHPRDKLPVGERLAEAAMTVAYGEAGPTTGPTLSGCELDEAAETITFSFNQSLLHGDSLELQDCRFRRAKG